MDTEEASLLWLLLEMVEMTLKSCNGFRVGLCFFFFFFLVLSVLPLTFGGAGEGFFGILAGKVRFILSK